MGLDMYAYKTKEAVPPVDFDLPSDGEQLAHWREHPNLYGWMEALYRIKGGSKSDFNYAPLRLDAGDLDSLERALRGALPDTVGFFFGRIRPKERDIDLAFVAKARKAFADGYVIVYYAWW